MSIGAFTLKLPCKIRPQCNKYQLINGDNQLSGEYYKPNA